MTLTTTVSVALIVFLGIFSQWLAWKISKPAIVIMSVCGLIVGPMFGLIIQKAIIGNSLYKSIISLSVALILFEGSLSLNFEEIRDTKMTIKRIVIYGAFIAWVLGSACAYFVGGLSITTSLVIGAILIVTGPTVILPLLRQAKLDRKVSSILKWEGILVDPLGAILAVFSFELARVFTSSDASMAILVKFGIGVVISVIIGLAIGYFTGIALQKNFFPEYLKAAIVMCLVIGAYTLGDTVAHETGLLSVTVMGVVMANMHIRSIEDVKHFNDNISVLLTSSVFIMLTASLSRELLVNIFRPEILMFVLAMLFVVRPLSIWLSTIGADLSKEEKLLLGWIAPRGIVALTVTGYFSNLLISEGYEDARMLLPLTFALVVVTVVAHGFSIQPLAKKLGIAHDGKPGLLIVGSNKFSVAFADFLSHLEIPCLIVDYADKNIELAAANGIDHYQGEILYELENYNLDLVIYKKLLINTPIPLYNVLVSNELTNKFGGGNVCIVNVLGDKFRNQFKELKNIKSPRLGDYRATHLKLVSLIEEGYVFKATKIDENLTEESYYESSDYRRINICSIDQDGDIEFFTTAHHPRVGNGDYIVSLSPADPHDTGEEQYVNIDSSELYCLVDTE